jgi:hypothetical protein
MADKFERATRGVINRAAAILHAAPARSPLKEDREGRSKVSNENDPVQIINEFGKLFWYENHQAIEEALSNALRRSLADAGRDDDYEEASLWLPMCWRLCFAAGVQDAITMAIGETARLARIRISHDKHDANPIIKEAANVARERCLTRLRRAGRIEPVGRGERRRAQDTTTLADTIATLTEREEFFEDVRNAIASAWEAHPKRKPTMAEIAEALEIGSKYSARGYYTGSPTLSRKLLRSAREIERELARSLGRELSREEKAKWKSGGEVFAALLAEVRRRLDVGEIDPNPES